MCDYVVGLAHEINTPLGFAVDELSSARSSFRLAELVKDTLAMLAPQIKAVGHRVEFERPPDLTMNRYPGAIMQVLAYLALKQSQSLSWRGSEGVQSAGRRTAHPKSDPGPGFSMFGKSTPSPQHELVEG